MKPKVALLAFGGSLPIAVTQSLKNNNTPFHVIGFKEYPADINCNQMISLGQIGKLFSILKKENITHIALAGYLKRPHLWGLRFDITGLKTTLKLLPSLRKGDDALLRHVITILEEQGIKMLSLKEICPELLLPKGHITHDHPSQKALETIAYGKKILSLLSGADMGQSVAICDEVILAAEALEGTDAMIKRCQDIPSSRRKNLSAPILVKAAKKGQSIYADLPVIGLETLRNLKESGFQGIGIEAGSVLCVFPDEVIRYAQKEGLFIYGFD